MCELEGFGVNVRGKPIKCGGGEQNHHLLNMSKLSRVFKRDPKARQYIEVTHQEIFICSVCAKHNAALKTADTKAAQRHLLKGKSVIFTPEYTRGVVDGFQEFLKVPEPMWTYKGIMAAPLPE